MAETVRLYYLYRGLSSAFLFKAFIVFFYLERGLTFSSIGILQSIFAITIMVFEVPTGIYSDKFGRKWAMATGALIMSATSMCYYFAWNFAAFAALEFFFALGLTLTSGADSAFLYDALKRVKRLESYPEMEGKATFFKYTGIAISSVTGGIIASYNLALLFPFTSIVIFSAFIVSRFMDRTNQLESIKNETQIFHFRRAAAEMKKSRSVWWVILYSSMIFLLIRASDTYLHPIMKGQGFSYFLIGLTAAGGALVAAFAGRYTSYLMKKRSLFFLICTIPLILISSFLLFLYGKGFALALILLINLGVQGIYSPFTKSLLNWQIQESSIRATVLSLESSVKRIFIVALMPIAGFLIDKNGFKSGLIMLATVSLVFLILLIMKIPNSLNQSGTNVVSDLTDSKFSDEIQKGKSAFEVGN